MRSTTAYFAGAGTVVVAIAAGLGGGLLLGDIMSPQQPKQPGSEVTRLEQRMSPQPIPATNGASQPVPYMAASQIANTLAEQPAPPQQAQQAPPQQAPQQPQPQQAQQQPQPRQASTQPADPPKQPERSAAPQPATAAAQPPASAEQPAARAPEDSFAKAREADLKRRAEDKRKAERRQQWTDRRKWRERDGDDLRDVETSVREDTASRPFGRSEVRLDRSEPRSMFGREPLFGTGRMTLFDD